MNNSWFNNNTKMTTNEVMEQGGKRRERVTEEKGAGCDQ